jgi:hypothetical protein
MNQPFPYLEADPLLAVGQPQRLVQGARGPLRCRVRDHDLGFGRMIASEIEVPNLLVNLV